MFHSPCFSKLPFGYLFSSNNIFEFLLRVVELQTAGFFNLLIRIDNTDLINNINSCHIFRAGLNRQYTCHAKTCWLTMIEFYVFPLAKY